eukprot:8257575-Alexandrium_andersonii.AAC.1
MEPPPIVGLRRGARVTSSPSAAGRGSAASARPGTTGAARTATACISTPTWLRRCGRRLATWAG